MRHERTRHPAASPWESADPRAGRLLTCRYEWKYLVPDLLVPELRRFIRPFVRRDCFATRTADGRYPICSLYLDTADLMLYEQTRCGEKNRFKLRIRSYSDSPEAAVFLEIKRKVDRVVRKRRAAVPRRTVEPLFRSGSGAVGSFPGSQRPPVDEFLNLVRASAVAPVTRIRYRREAYESAAGDPVRITFDTDLCYRITQECCLRQTGESWSSVPLAGTILELKFTDRFPGWIGEMIRCFELQRRSVAKYVLSMENAIESGLYRPWPIPSMARRGS